jgi:S-adenosyl-L-methionine hydrolase (adenosine-forming)
MSKGKIFRRYDARIRHHQLQDRIHLEVTTPLITLCTDFGTVDGYVAQMKGVIHSICFNARLIDMTHDIAPQDVRAGAYVIATAAPRFPQGTIHVGVVDPGVGGRRRGIILCALGHVFIGPDNGLFSPFLDGVEEAYELIAPPGSSTTFHGRDLFAPAAARIAAGENPANLGTPLRDLARLDEWTKTISDERVEGRITHIDRFGNVITNLRPEDFEKTPKSLFVRDRDAPKDLPILETYCRVKEDAALWLVGSGGFYELAVRNANAAERFDIRRGDVVSGRS